MGLALDQARKALAGGDVPVGAVILSDSGQLLATGFNRREVDQDPTGHAELVALQSAGRALDSWRLPNCTLVVTLEPCAMCAGAIVQAQIARVVFGAWDAKMGAAGSVWDLLRDRQSPHWVEVVPTVRAAECAQLLVDFFAERRLG